jgi:hypothetical protein
MSFARLLHSQCPLLLPQPKMTSPTRPARPPPRVFFPPGEEQPFSSVARSPSGSVSTPKIDGFTFHLVPPTPGQQSFSDVVHRDNELHFSDQELHKLKPLDNFRAAATEINLDTKSNVQKQIESDGYDGDDEGVLRDIAGNTKELKESVCHLDAMHEEHGHDCERGAYFISGLYLVFSWIFLSFR